MSHLFKSSRTKIYAAFAVLTAFILTLVLVLTNTGLGHSLIGRTGAVEDYTAQLTYSNGGSGFGSSYSSTEATNSSARTSGGNPIVFKYVNVKQEANKFAKVANGGYFYNPIDYQIIGLETVNVTFSGGSLSLYSSKTATFSGDAKSLTSGTEVAIKANYDYFKIVASGETTIDNIVLTYTCSERVDDAYHLVDSSSELEAGQYLIVSVSDGLAFDGSRSTLDAVGNKFTVTISDGTIQDDSTTSGKHVTLSQSGSDWVITAASGSNVGHDNSSRNGLNGNGYNSISIDDGIAMIYSESGKAFAYNSKSDQTRFRYFNYPFGDGINEISLFKLGSGSSGGGSGGGDDPTPPSPTGDLPNGSYSATFGYSNPEPSSVNIYNSSDVAVSTLSTSISAVETYNDTYEEYVLAKDSYIVISNETNALIQSITVNIYQYRNFDVYVDGSATPIYEGDGLKGSGDPVTVEITVNASSEIKIVSNGGSGSYTLKIYSVELNLVVEQAVAVTGVSIDSTLALGVGEKSSLTPTFTPSDATNKNVLWNSSDTTVATIAADGTITALKAGTTTITVTTVDGNFTDTCLLTVNNIVASSFVIDQSSLEIYVGDDAVLSTTFEPFNVTDQSITWSSSNSSVVSVSNGTVHAEGEGTATITATSNGISDTCSITVKPASQKPQEEIVDATYGTGNNLSQCTVNDHDGVKVGTSKAGGTFKVIVPANTTKLSIYAAAWNGVTGLSLNISGATTNPSSIALTADSGVANNSPFTLVGNEEDYLFEILLSNVSEETELVFATSLEKRCVSWGAKATVTTDGSTPAVVAVTGVSVDPTSKTLNVDETVQLAATVSPTNATNKSVNWSSNDATVATVSSSGLVTAKKSGSATITVASAADSTKTATCAITVAEQTVAVTGVTMSVSSKTISVDEDFALTATVTPSNASNKAIIWTSSDSTIATVSNGTVHGVAAGGPVTITATSAADSTKKATCSVTVEASGGGDTPAAHVTDVINNAATVSDLGSTSTSSWKDFSLTMPSGVNYQVHSMGTSGGSHALQWNGNGYLYSTTSGGEITKVSAVMNSGKSISVRGSNSVISTSGGGTSLGTLTGTNSLTSNAGYKYIRIEGVSSGNAISSITIEYGEAEPVNLTGISIPETASIGLGKTMTLDVTYLPSDFNQSSQEGVTWSSSKTNIATVNATTGVITPVAAGTTTITATSTYNSSFTDTCTLTVVEQATPKWTIMIYMCGADLESDGGQASGDIKEILNVANQPDDVNIIIETGGTSAWQLGSSYIKGGGSISASKLTRWHVENQQLVKDAELSNASMGKAATYQSFLTWGLTSYPAEKTGVVLWNHGGGLDGVCFDENYSDDALYNSEMKTAHANAIGSGNKLEWIGYDACLMQNMEIAEFNSAYFNYQVASQESENGSGWYYTGWIDNVYNHNETTVILKEIVDTFITTQGTSSDQTLSYLNLSYASTFKTAWENYASVLKSKFQSGSVSGSTFANWAKNNIKNYSEDGYCGYGQFDVTDWVNKCQNQSSYSVDSSYKTAITNALTNFVGYSRKGSKAGNSNGVCCTYRCASQVSYDSSESNFTNWRSFNTSYHA